ncbi:hypothetical protein [Actinoplanes subtropicus]|uniref:hypothetical protein n=1 Tax=Actinoplanes subtropicus TaxID=543632 RepID=UPI003CCC1D40
MAARTLGGRYQLVRRIGRGGMSEVWHGHDAVLDRPVAIKVIAPGQDVTVDLVRAEARSAAASPTRTSPACTTSAPAPTSRTS